MTLYVVADRTNLEQLFRVASPWPASAISFALSPKAATAAEGFVRMTLQEFLDSPQSALKSGSANSGVESEWLPFVTIELLGSRLRIADVYMIGTPGEGVELAAEPGRYALDAKVMTFDDDRRISRLRVQRAGLVGVLGEPAGEVGVDLAAVGVTDGERIRAFFEADNDAFQEWGDALWYQRNDMVGVWPCEPADTTIAYVDSGFGDGTFPVWHLMHDGVAVGLEIEFIAPETPHADSTS